MAEVPRGRFVWHELMTTEPDAAQGFYASVVGWGSTNWDQDPSYRLLTMQGTPMAGLLRLPDEARASGAPPHWLTYIAVPDVEGAVARATGLGASVYVQPQDVPSVGRFAVLADPQGAVFAVFRPAQPGGSEELTLGDFSWHELATTNWQAAWEFYAALFGWEFDSSVDMGPAGTYWMFRSAGGKRSVGGMYTKPPEMQAPAHWLPYILVPSVDRTIEAVRRHGGQVLNGPMEVPGGDWIAQCLDPQGGVFAIHSRKPVARPATPTVKRPRKKSPAAKRSARKVAKRSAKKVAKVKKATKKAARKKPVRRTAAKKGASRKKPLRRRPRPKATKRVSRKTRRSRSRRRR